MRYFKRDEHYYLKVDDDTKTISEVFDTPGQQRIMLSTNQTFYNNMLNRITDQGFVETTELAFYEKLQATVTFINNL